MDHLPSGTCKKHSEPEKTQFLMGKSTISMDMIASTAL